MTSLRSLPATRPVVTNLVFRRSPTDVQVAPPTVPLLAVQRPRPAFSRCSSSSSSASPPVPSPPSPFPIFTTIKSYRRWRRQIQRSAILSTFFASTHEPSSSGSAEDQAEQIEGHAGSVGFVPTMGALHQGHLDLVRKSLRENRHTVVSIFVNPAQFAPTEDLASYPRTLERDLASLVALEEEVRQTSASEALEEGLVGGPEEEGNLGKISAIFCPDVREMYPPLPGTRTPFTQNVGQQQGAFVEVQGLSNVLEGKSRPGFFRGVATVVTKLWHIIEPTRVYFGQKDIQQALILRALLTSLLFQSPDSFDSSRTFRLVPTTRDQQTGLALSSRNAYLGEAGRKWAPTLYRALSCARDVFQSSSFSSSSSPSSPSPSQGRVRGWDQRIQAAQEAKRQAAELVQRANEEAQFEDVGVRLELDYISFNSATTLAALDIGGGTDPPQATGPSQVPGHQSQDPSLGGTDALQEDEAGVVLSGAMWVVEGPRRTRMIDNMLLGKAGDLLV